MKITMESGMIPHDIELKAPDAGMDLKMDLSSTPQVMRFTPTKTGEFTFYCTKKLLFFESHKDKGMVGTLGGARLMIPREWLDVLRIVHGSYNAIVALAFILPGLAGAENTKGTKGGGRPETSTSSEDTAAGDRSW